MPRRPLKPQERLVHPSASGGILRNRRRGRGQRTLSLCHSMHLVLRAAWGRGAWSFTAPRNRRLINQILSKHSERTGVRLFAIGNAGNHLHLRMQIPSRKQYCKFIRAVTGEIALKLKKQIEEFYGEKQTRFWERRPFSSIISGARYVARIAEYIKINELEGRGFLRPIARLEIEKWSKRNAELRAAPS